MALYSLPGGERYIAADGDPRAERNIDSYVRTLHLLFGPFYKPSDNLTKSLIFIGGDNPEMRLGKYFILRKRFPTLEELEDRRSVPEILHSRFFHYCRDINQNYDPALKSLLVRLIDIDIDTLQENSNEWREIIALGKSTISESPGLKLIRAFMFGLFEMGFDLPNAFVDNAGEPDKSNRDQPYSLTKLQASLNCKNTKDIIRTMKIDPAKFIKDYFYFVAKKLPAPEIGYYVNGLFYNCQPFNLKDSIFFRELEDRQTWQIAQCFEENLLFRKDPSGKFSFIPEFF